MLLGVWISLSLVEAEIPPNEVPKGHVYRESLLADPDNVIHAKVTQLVQHH